MVKSAQAKAIVALIVANIIWGIGSPLFKWSFQSIHPFTLAFARFFIPTIVLGILYNKRLKIHTKDIPIFVLSGLTGITINIGLYFIGIHYTKSINAPIIASAGPAFLILGSIFFLKEHPTKRMLLGNIVGLTGILFILLEPLLTAPTKTLLENNLFGNLLLIIATLGSVVGTLFARDLTKKYSAPRITFWNFAVATLTFAPFFFWDGLHANLLHELSFQGSIAVIFGGVFSSLLAYSLLFYALEYVPASSVGIFDYLQPIVAILVAAPLIHEYPTPLFLLGAGMVVGGIFMAENHAKFHLFHHVFKSR